MRTEQIRVDGEPEKIPECDQCRSTKTLRTILQAAMECDAVTHLNPIWVKKECRRGLGITYQKPQKFG